MQIEGGSLKFLKYTCVVGLVTFVFGIMQSSVLIQREDVRGLSTSHRQITCEVVAVAAVVVVVVVVG